MQNVNATITFSLNNAAGEQLHKTTLEYAGLNEERVLFIEKHLIAFLAGLNTEAAAAAAKQVKK